MKFGKALLTLCVLAILPGLTGCVDNDLSITIVGNFVLTDKCLVDTATMVGRGRGILDIGLAAALNEGYLMVPRVKNQLPATASGGGGGGMGGQGMSPIEMNNVFVLGWEVEIVANPDDPISDVLQPNVPDVTSVVGRNAGGILTAGGGTVTASVEVFEPAAAAMLLSNRLVKPGPAGLGDAYQNVTVRIRAKTSRSGMTLNSQWFEYPLDLCAFCNVIKPGTNLSGYDPGSGSLFECPDPNMVPEESLPTIACTPAQDSVIPCCLQNRQVLCGLEIPHKPKSSM